MSSGRPSVRLAAVCAVAAGLVALGTPPARAAGGTPSPFAALGDTPCGAADVARPGIVDQVDADPEVRLVAHLGDTGSGSTVCSDASFAEVRRHDLAAGVDEDLRATVDVHDPAVVVFERVPLR